MNADQPPPQHAPTRLTINEFIIQKVRELVIRLYGEQGHTLGDDGDFVIGKKPFDKIIKLPRKQWFVEEVQRRYDCCDRVDVKTTLSRPPKSGSNMQQLKLQLKNILPSVIETEGDEQAQLNYKKQQLDAIRQIVEQHPQNTGYDDACMAVWDAMQNPDHILGTEIPPRVIPDDPVVVEMQVGWPNAQPPPPPAQGSPVAQRAPQDTATVPMVIKSGSSRSTTSTVPTAMDTNSFFEGSLSAANEPHMTTTWSGVPDVLCVFGMNEKINNYLKDTCTREQLQHELQRRLHDQPQQKHHDGESVEHALQRLSVLESPREAALVKIVLDLLNEREQNQQVLESICSFDPSGDEDSYNYSSDGNDDDDMDQDDSPNEQQQQTNNIDRSSGQGPGGSNTTTPLGRYVLLDRSSTTNTEEAIHTKTQQDQTTPNRPTSSTSQEDASTTTMFGEPLEKEQVDLDTIATDKTAAIDSDERSEFSSLHDELGGPTVVAIEANDEMTDMGGIDGAFSSLSLSEKKTNRQSMLHWASKNGNVGAVSYLIGKNVDIDARDEGGVTALHMAGAYGHLNVVQLLVESKASIGARTKRGNVPLHIASQNGHLDIVKYLIERNAEIEARSERGETPLYSASQYGHLNIVRFLIESNADIEAKQKQGCTPLHNASWAGNLRVVQFLVENMAELEARNKWDETPLHIASQLGNLDIVKFLVKNKADTEAKEQQGCTPLHIASQDGNLDVVKFLVESNADMEVQTNDGVTPLRFASLKGHLNVAQFLRSKGATE